MEAKWLNQFLEECLQVERSGLELYKGAISRRADDDIRRHLEAYRDQTARHVEIVEGLLEHFKGNASRMKEAMGTVMGTLTSGLSALQGTGEYQQWKDLDNLLLAEQKCHSNWQILKTVALSLQDPVLTRAVDEVEAQEDEHVAWLQGVVMRLAPGAIAPIGG